MTRTSTLCGVYCRISDDRQGEALGVARQEKDGRTLAKRKGWQVADVYVDNDISATRKRGKVKRRPAFEQLRDDLAAHRITAIVAWDFDRLFRDPLEQEQFFLLCEQVGGIKVATIGDEVDISSGHGLLVARIKGAVAAEEARKISERSRRKHLELAQAGAFAGGGTRPFGFDDDRVTIRLDEAGRIREAATRVLAGESLRSICATWNAEGITTVTGRPWTTTVLRRVLTAGRTAGWREHRGALVTEAVWPAILDRATVDRLRAVLLDPARRVNGNPRKYLLTGIAVCGLCGARLVARPRDDKRRAYVCASGPDFGGCGKIGALAETLEDEVAKRLAARVDRPELAKDVAEDRSTPLLEALSIVEAQLEQAGRDHYVERVTGRTAFLAVQRELTARQAALRAELGRVERRGVADALTATDEPLRDRWDGLGFDHRRAVLESWVQAVVVSPAVRGRTRFDPGRVRVEWAR